MALHGREMGVGLLEMSTFYLIHSGLVRVALFNLKGELIDRITNLSPMK